MESVPIAVPAAHLQQHDQSHGFRRIIRRRILLFLMGGRHWKQPTDVRNTQRGVSGESGFRRAAAHLHGRHMGFLPAVSRGYDYADSAGQRRHGREQRKGGAVQPWHFLFRVAPQQRYGRTDLPCTSLMR